MDDLINKLHADILSSKASNKGVMQFDARSSKKKVSESLTPVNNLRANLKMNKIEEIDLSDEVISYKPPKSTKNMHNRQVNLKDFNYNDNTLSSQMTNFVQNYDDLLSLFQTKQPIKNQEQLEEDLKTRSPTLFKKQATKSHDKLIKSI